jgi:hypothetical protein
VISAAGVVPEAQAVRHAGGNGDDVLHHTGELDSAQVAVHVGSQCLAGHDVLEGAGEDRIAGGDDRCRGLVFRHLLGVIGTGKDRDSGSE